MKFLILHLNGLENTPCFLISFFPLFIANRSGILELTKNYLLNNTFLIYSELPSTCIYYSESILNISHTPRKYYLLVWKTIEAMLEEIIIYAKKSLGLK